MAVTRQDVVARGFSWSYLMPRSSKSPTQVDHPRPPLEQDMEIHFGDGIPTHIVDRLPNDFQGFNSVMYAVRHGWDGVPAVAKTPTNGKSMDQERAILEKVGTFSNLSAFIAQSSSNFPTGRTISFLRQGYPWPLLVGHERCEG